MGQIEASIVPMAPDFLLPASVWVDPETLLYQAKQVLGGLLEGQTAIKSDIASFTRPEPPKIHTIVIAEQS